MKTYFEKADKNSNAWIFHHGIFTDNNGKDFDFSLLEMQDENSGTSSFELTFCDDSPQNEKEAESFIMKEFSNGDE